MLENNKNLISEETKESIKKEILDRISRVSDTFLNSRNMFKAFNEHAISLINYYIGLVDFKLDDYNKIDLEIRKILYRKKVCLKPANKERIHIDRKNYGRGLKSLRFRAESILLSLYNYLMNNKENNIRKMTIIKFEETNSNNELNNINNILMNQYNIGLEQLNKVELEKEQNQQLLNIINNKILHKIMFNKDNCTFRDDIASSYWLKYGKLSPNLEGLLMLVQDRNFFSKSVTKCNHCNERIKIVDHISTKCDKLLFSYRIRHDEVLKCIHLSLIRKYNFSDNSKIKYHKMSKCIENSFAKIITDTNICSESNIRYNKPDIIVFDKLNKLIRIIELGITNQDDLQAREVHKKQKYIELGNYLSATYRMKVEITPIALTWDGMVIIYNKGYRKVLDIDHNTLAYMQVISLKKTFELMASNTIEFKWEKSKMNLEEGIENIINRIIEINENTFEPYIERNEILNMESDIEELVHLNKNTIDENDGDDDVFFDCQ